MNTSLISKLNKPLLVLCLVSIFAFIATKAYFTANTASDDSIFTSGNLQIAVVQDEVLQVENWKPGDIHILEFTVQNTGSLPTHVKGYLDGDWSSEGLDPQYFEITALEREIGGQWVAVTQDGLEVSEEFFLSSDGTDQNLFELAAGDSTKFRLTTQLSSETPDEYQNEVFTTALHVAGKQVAQGSAWPIGY